MSIRHTRIPFNSIRDADTVCFRCLRKLTKAPSAPRPERFFSSVSAQKQSAIAAGKSRNAVGKDYFWANGVLKEVFGRPRRDIQSSIATARLDEAKHGPRNTDAAPTEELLPHRLRKKRKEEEQEQLKQQQEQSQSHTSESAPAESPSQYPIAPDASATLANLSSTLPTHSLKRTLVTYLSLSKPRLSFLVVLTATAAYSLYPVPHLLGPTATAAPSLSTLTLFFLTSGTALCSASANALNMLMEHAHDAKMSRTRNRPLVRGLLSSRAVLGFAMVCGVLGTGALAFGVGPTTAGLGAANIVLYAGLYTPLKRISVLNTWVGAIVGGIPPLMGWTAAASQYASHAGSWDELLFSRESVGGWLLAALLFAWQFPHSNSLSWAIRDEYKRAGYRMLVWVNPAQNGRVALRYSFLMFPVCIGLSYVGVTDWSFVATSSVINGWMAVRAWQFWKMSGAGGSARGLFWASVWHLPIVMVLAMAQKKGLAERIWRSLVGWGEEGEEELWYDVGEAEEMEGVDARSAVRSEVS